MPVPPLAVSTRSVESMLVSVVLFAVTVTVDCEALLIVMVVDEVTSRYRVPPGTVKLILHEPGLKAATSPAEVTVQIPVLVESTAYVPVSPDFGVDWVLEI